MTATPPQSTPTPPELTRAPECAALSLLDNALYTATFALLAINPRVADADFEPCAFDRRELLAEAIIKQSEALQSILRRYRETAAGWQRVRLSDDMF
jgi:hypothetical protein